jgi:hypothetical protein
MKLIKILVIFLFILNLVTPVNKLFTAHGYLDGGDYGPSCRIHFTKDEGIIFAIKLGSILPKNFEYKEFKEITANTFSEADDIINSNERGFLVQYSDLGLLYYSEVWVSPELKFYNNKLTVLF